MRYRKVLLALLAVVVSVIVVATTMPKVNANAYNTIAYEDSSIKQQKQDLPNKITYDVSTLPPRVIQEEEMLVTENVPEVKTEPVQDTKLYELVDLWNFKPSYNMVVTQALVRVGAPEYIFIEWYEETFGVTVTEDDWSLAFMHWCVNQANATYAIPTYHNFNELETFFRENKRFYQDGTACLPKVGDLLLIDDDGDKIADHINIVSYYERNTAMIESVGGCIWSEDDGKYVVKEERHFIRDKAIVGVCRPDYGLKQDTTYSDPEIIFNAVDTVSYLSKPEYAQALADAGIEVIARYINPEGRQPLDIEEAQRYSDAGVRIMMIYQINTNDPYKGYDTGYLFGTKALEYARNLNAPKGTPIFFCCDCACDIRNFDKVAQFIIGVKDAMQGEYGVGLYGGYYVNEAMYNLGLIDAHWQSLGFNDGYLSPNMDMFQSSTSTPWFSKIPTMFDSNYVKNPEKVSYIMPPSTNDDSFQ